MEAILNKERFDRELKRRSCTAKSYYYFLTDEHNLEMTYTNFMMLAKNRSSWKLKHAMVLARSMNLMVEDLFEIVEDKALTTK